MVEEIKLTWKGTNNINLDLFIGKVVKVTNEFEVFEIVIVGKDLKLNESEIQIVLSSNESTSINALHSIKNLKFIELNDILQIRKNNIRSIYRNSSDNNSIFATVRCNSNCLMCSQPPLDYDDTLDNILAWNYAIDLMPQDVKHIGFTGGEPTILGVGLVELINKLTDKYPTIIIDILSNGRLQAKDSFIEILSKVKKPNQIIFAIPLYSDIYKEHDYIVQAKDAFYQTILGIHKLASLGFLIEIRVVLHQLSIRRLENLSRFIHKNLPFVYHIALMGLENIGYTKANKEKLFFNNSDFIETISNSILFLETWNYNVSIYNMPNCHLPKPLWKNARQSISDWKNSFKPECDNCLVKKSCAGFFSWNLESAEVYPVLDEN